MVIGIVLGVIAATVLLAFLHQKTNGTSTKIATPVACFCIAGGLFFVGTSINHGANAVKDVNDTVQTFDVDTFQSDMDEVIATFDETATTFDEFHGDFRENVRGIKDEIKTLNCTIGQTFNTKGVKDCPEGEG